MSANTRFAIADVLQTPSAPVVQGLQEDCNVLCKPSASLRNVQPLPSAMSMHSIGVCRPCRTSRIGQPCQPVTAISKDFATPSETYEPEVRTTSEPPQPATHSTTYGTAVTALSRYRVRARESAARGQSWWIGDREHFRRTFQARERRQRLAHESSLQHQATFMAQIGTIRIPAPDTTAAGSEFFCEGVG